MFKLSIIAVQLAKLCAADVIAERSQNPPPPLPPPPPPAHASSQLSPPCARKNPPGPKLYPNSGGGGGDGGGGDNAPGGGGGAPEALVHGSVWPDWQATQLAHSGFPASCNPLQVLAGQTQSHPQLEEHPDDDEPPDVHAPVPTADQHWPPSHSQQPTALH